MTFGRNPDVTVCILSTMISRCHAILKKTETGSWTIKDNKVRSQWERCASRGALILSSLLIRGYHSRGVLSIIRND